MSFAESQVREFDGILCAGYDAMMVIEKSSLGLGNLRAALQAMHTDKTRSMREAACGGLQVTDLAEGLTKKRADCRIGSQSS